MTAFLVVYGFMTLATAVAGFPVLFRKYRDELPGWQLCARYVAGSLLWPVLVVAGLGRRRAR
ncbi:MAG TPA: hypothetical protein VGI66_17910 [Streptosporangiaceae bacterium]